MLKNVPIVGKEYNCFDNGKIRPSRLYSVIVDKVIPFKDIDKETFELWKREVKEYNWLYDKLTDYFVFTTNCDKEKEIFVRTRNDEWFSITGGLGGGKLDIDGSLLQCMYVNYLKYVNENKEE